MARVIRKEGIVPDNHQGGCHCGAVRYRVDVDSRSR